MTEIRQQCSVCNTFKTYRSYSKKCDTKSGYSLKCKECVKKESKEYRLSNQPSIVKERHARKRLNMELGDSYIRRAISSAISRAKSKGYSNYDTKEELFKYLKSIGGVPRYCPILDIELIYGGGSIGNSPSLDRIDVRKGYTRGNVWFISARANMMKNDASFKELQRFSKYFINNFTSWGKKRKK